MKLKNMIALAALIAAFSLTTVAQTVVVTPTNQQGWSTADTRPGGSVNFVVDSTAPAGIGALRLTTDSTNAAKAQYMHETNTPIGMVNTLSYMTKQNSGGINAAASYQLPVCLGGIGAATPTNPTGCIGFTTFVFEPYQANGVCCTPIPQGTWQSWDVDAGMFWSSRTVSAGGSCNFTAGAGGPPFYSLATIQSNCPAAIAVGFGVNIGTFNPNYDVETDLVQFNTTTYDFEPYIVATNGSQCKNGGWQTLRRADGSTFKNQGDCVSYTNNGR